jgi:hypothetical protein
LSLVDRNVTIVSKSGIKFLLRPVRIDDADDFVKLFNSLVENGADIITDKKVTRADARAAVRHRP